MVATQASTRAAKSHCERSRTRSPRTMPCPTRAPQVRAAMADPMTPIQRLSCSSCSPSGVSSSSASAMAVAARPTSVRSPTCSTRAMPRPSVTREPRSTRSAGYVCSSAVAESGRLSRRASPVGAGPACAGMSSTRGCFSTCVDSPVRRDSSTSRELASSTRASAGTSSPPSRITRSPTTTSRRGMVSYPWERRTLTPTSSLTWFRRSNSRPAWYSLRNAMAVARKMAMRMPTLSKYSPWAVPARIDRSAAIIRMRMTGSSNFSRNSRHQGARGGGVSTLEPCWRRLSATCSGVSPANPAASCHTGRVSAGTAPGRGGSGLPAGIGSWGVCMEVGPASVASRSGGWFPALSRWRGGSCVSSRVGTEVEVPAT